MEKGKVLTLEDRIPKLKTQRKQKANRRLVFYISFFFLLILFIIYFQSPLSEIKQIETIGNHFVSDTEIIDTLKIEQNQNFWTVNVDELTAKVQGLQEVESVEISRQFPTGLQINVLEYERVAYIELEGSYYPILHNGDVLTSIKNDAIPVNAPILVNWEDREEIQEMAAELRKLSESIIHRISEIHLTPTETDPFRLILYMNDGFMVDTTVLDFANKMEEYPSIVQTLDQDEKGIIHMTVSPWLDRFSAEEEPTDEN
jgi:cell division protein FtsQ